MPIDLGAVILAAVSSRQRRRLAQWYGSLADQRLTHGLRAAVGSDATNDAESSMPRFFRVASNSCEEGTGVDSCR